jgi:hypothetical protein
MLMVNIEDPEHPAAQAYFPSGSWSRSVIDEDEILVASGRYGIQQLDLDATNILFVGE